LKKNAKTIYVINAAKALLKKMRFNAEYVLIIREKEIIKQGMRYLKHMEDISVFVVAKTTNGFYKLTI